IVGAAQAVIALHEDDGFRRDRHAYFVRMIGIVEADGEEFGGAADDGTNPWLAADRGKLGRVEGSDLAQRGRRKGVSGEVCDMRRKVPDLTRLIDQAGLFLALLPVTNKL